MSSYEAPCADLTTELYHASHMLTASERRTLTPRSLLPGLICYDQAPPGRRTYVATATLPEATLHAIAADAPAQPFVLRAIEHSPEDRERYLAAGWLMEGFDTLMTRSLPTPWPGDPDAQYIGDAQGWERWNAMPARTPNPDPEYHEPHLRHWICAQDGQPLARGRSAVIAPGYAWITNIFTAPAARRQGWGRRIMYTILADAAAQGAHTAVLLSTAKGLALYDALGFQRHWTLLYFDPPAQ